MKVSGHSTTSAPLPEGDVRRRLHHRLNGSVASRGIRRSAAIPPSRFAARASGRSETSALTAAPARSRATARSHTGSRPML